MKLKTIDSLTLTAVLVLATAIFFFVVSLHEKVGVTTEPEVATTTPELVEEAIPEATSEKDVPVLPVEPTSQLPVTAPPVEVVVPMQEVVPPTPAGVPTTCTRSNCAKHRTAATRARRTCCERTTTADEYRKSGLGYFHSLQG